MSTYWEIIRRNQWICLYQFTINSYVNDILTSLFGFCCFFGTIKFLKLCRFNQQICLFIQTLKYAGKALISFSMMFSIIFMSFLCLFYLLFTSKISSCSTLLGTAQMLFEMTCMKFDVHDLSGAAAFLGPFSFSLFIILVVFICMNMFISIINDSFRRARENLHDNQEIFSFMMKKFQRWIGIQSNLNQIKIISLIILGWKKATEEELQEERDVIMRSQYFDPIERFPEKIDQLLDALNRVCRTFIMSYSIYFC